MWDEEIHKKIKDAADQYHPAYDDDAWNKMERLLNVHLPRKRDRKRIVYFLPLILLLAGIIFFMITRKEEKPALSDNNLEKSRHEQNFTPGKVATTTDAVTSGQNLMIDKRKNELSGKSSENDHGTKITQKVSGHGSMRKINSKARLNSDITLPGNQENQKENIPPSIKKNDNQNPIKKYSTDESITQPGKPAHEKVTSAAETYNNETTPVTGHIEDEKETLKPKDVMKTDATKNANSTTRLKKPKKNFIENFGIGLGAGADISAVRLSNTGKPTFTYGAELSYTFSDKFTLRSGFYVDKKVYSAQEDDYHIPSGSLGNYNFLESINANCKIYEIPLTLSYNFGKVKNHNWLVSAGLSSYFMKKESYVFFYKYPSGIVEHRSWSVSNKNEHYFSVLDISAGYVYAINKRFYVRAEPYVKLPLSGIGMGKIKLNSAGVLFTATVKPFSK